MALLRDRCPACGFDPATVSPSDAAVAARSFPRRYRALLVRPDDDDGADVVRRSPPDGMSALEHTAVAVEELRLVGAGVRAAAVSDAPPVALTPHMPRYESVDIALQHLAEAADGLAAAVESFDSAEWDRPVLVDGAERATALDVVRHGIHAGVHRLRAAERAVDEVRGRP